MHRLLFLPSIALCVLSTACSVSHDAAEPFNQTSEQALQSSAVLGQGYDEEYHQEKDSICIYNYRERLQWVGRRSMRAFQTYQGDEVDLKVNANVDVDGNLDFVSGSLKTKLNEHYNAMNSKAVLGVVVYVHSVNRVLEKNGTGGPPPVNDNGPLANRPEPHCDPSNPSKQMDTLSDFLNVCGDRYVSEQKLGGFITLLVDVSTLNRTDRTTLESKLKVGAKAVFTGNVDVAFNTISTASRSLQSLRFQVEGYGIPSPDPSLLVNGGMPASNWANYMRQVENSYSQAYQQWNSNKTSEHAYDLRLGLPIEQTYKQYNALDLEACARRGDGFGLAIEQLACYQRFWTADSWAYSDRKFSELQREIEGIKWALDHRHKIEWQTPVADHQAEFQAVVDRYNKCFQERPRARMRCAEARDDGRLDELCDTCQHTEDCRAETIKATIDNLSEASIKVADPKPVPLPPVNSAPRPPLLDPEFHSLTQNKDTSIGNLASEICVWSGLSGRMDGGGEGAKVYINANNQWAMKTWSSNNKYIRSHAICMPKQNFIGDASNTWHNEYIDEWSTYNAPTEFPIPYYNNNTLFALSGISGKMQGGGEYADLKTSYPATSTKIKVASQQGGLRAWTNAFGLEAPFNDRIRFVTGTFQVATRSGAREVQMSPSDSTLCYLKYVAGDFDGGAEHVEIVKRDGHWFMSVNSIWFPLLPYPLKTVNARAECIYFDQSRP